MNRRTASGMLVMSGTALFAGAVGIPVLVAGVSPALRSRHQAWQILGSLDDFPIGEVTRAEVAPEEGKWPRSFGQLSVFVWRSSPTEIVVYSRSCTDLGCPLAYDAGSGCFLCPCHGGIFTQNGQRLAGPPKSPMHRYSHRVRAEFLEIDVSSVPPAA